MENKANGYVTPKVTTYSESEVLDLLGPARTYDATDVLTTGTSPSGHGGGHGHGHKHGRHGGR